MFKALVKSIIPVKSLFQLTPTCDFSKYMSKSKSKRIPLNTKRAGKGYKKGYGARTEGRISSKGLLCS